MKRRNILGLMAVILLAAACEKPAVYEVNPEQVSPPNADKSKLKSEEQFISILYANLFQKALSANELLEITDVMFSIGDKDLAHEVVISNLMNEPDVILPSDSLMLADVDAFMDETYERFLVRDPTEAELTWFRNFIANNPTVTAELVYFAFALSNEYLYY